MNYKAILHLITYPLFLIGLGMLASWTVSVYKHDPLPAQHALAWSSIVTLAASLIVRRLTHFEEDDVRRREGFGIVTFGWVAAALFGCLPFVLSGVIPHPVSAFFEAMSGLTTTGASVLSNLESLPRGILMWRAMTHFFGGMGVLVLCVAILPFLGVGGMQLFQAEMPGPIKDRLTPRIQDTARLLWMVYVALILLETVLLRWGGMSWFDAVCHSFATIATGGFSTRSASVQAYKSPFVETVIIVFMFLAGANFALHYRALFTGQPSSYAKNPELRFYTLVWLAVGFLVTMLLWRHGLARGGEAVRTAFFQTTSILTTTGFSTCDFDQWSGGTRLVLLLLMFVGGCAGSTGGGIKIMRIMVVLKVVAREIRLFVRPQAVIPVRFGQDNLEDEAVSNIVAFVLIYMLIFVAGALLMCPFVPNLMTAISATAATLGNIGPGFAHVGPSTTYAQVPELGKALLSFFMLVGRLELYTVLVLFVPSTWKK